MLTSLIIDNWYVGIPLVIGLMLLDWLLTHVGYRFYLRYGKQHFEFEHYELNPIWQKDIEEKRKLFSARYFLMLTFICTLLVLVYRLEYHDVKMVLIGLACGAFLTLDLTHVENLLFYRAIARTPGGIEGRVRYSHGLTTLVAAIGYVNISVILSAVLLFTEPSAFSVAFALGPLVVGMRLYVSALRRRKAAAVCTQEKKEKRKVSMRKWLLVTLVVVVICFFALWVLGTYINSKYREDFQEAIDAYQREEYETAFKKFQTLHQKRPEDAVVHFNLALCYHNLGELEEAKKLFEHYVEQHKGTERAEEAQSMVEFYRRQLKNEEE